MENHGITITHELPDWDYCTWECRCGTVSQMEHIDTSYITAAMHIDQAKLDSKE